MEFVKDEPRRNCHDCNAKVGEHHKSGCDTERCPKCGGQLISCDCFRIGNRFNRKEFKKYEQEMWSGIMFEDAKLYAEANNLFCYDEVDNQKFHIPCDANHPKAHHDINMAIRKMPAFIPKLKKKKCKIK